jgi:CheY-like chemotaxis protein
MLQPASPADCGASDAASTVLLLADDEQDNRIVFSTILDHAGFEVVEAANGAEALDAARRCRPALILLDIAMPVMDGFEVIHRLQADPETARIPVAAVSAQDLTAERLKSAGFCAFLRKPVEPRRLLIAVRRCMEESARGVRWIDFAGAGSTG